MAVGALADQLEKPFINYMEAFLPILIQGLSNNAEYQVCQTLSNRARLRLLWLPLLLQRLPLLLLFLLLLLLLLVFVLVCLFLLQWS